MSTGERFVPEATVQDPVMRPNHTVLRKGDWGYDKIMAAQDERHCSIEQAAVSCVPGRLEKTIEWRDFFRDAFKEAHNLSYEGRNVQGPILKEFIPVYEGLSHELKKIHPELTPGCMFPGGYRSQADTQTKIAIFGNTIIDDRRHDYEARRHFRRMERATNEMLSPLLPKLLPQAVTSLSRTEHRRNFTGRGCVGSSFLMIMDAITGEQANDGELSTILNDTFGTCVVEDEVYLKIFQTTVFKERFGKSVQTASFIGADLATLETVAGRIKHSNPDTQVYCMVPLLSRTAGNLGRGILHTNVLLGADAKQVEVMEPQVSEFNGTSDFLNKVDFLQRWAQAQMRAHLIFSSPI